ncbi:MAG TPA: hypothetical protein VFV27_00015 [Nevskiaceae bacterium]|nr:hypothetical protein [Nevskiaceae bacterium]
MKTLEVLYEGAEVRLLYLAGPHDGTRCVCFSHFVRAGRPKPFALDFLQRYGRSGYFVVPTRNNWFQTPEMGPLVESLRQHAQGHPLLGYGASMGGFAALAFARPLGIRTAVVIAPQVALADRLVGDFERRWRREAAAVGEVAPDARTGMDPELDLLIAYDPLHRGDREHVRLIREAAGPRLRVLRLPGTRHSTLAALAASGVLSPLLRELLAGAGLDQAFREARERYRSASVRAAYTVRRFLAARGPRAGTSVWAQRLQTRYAKALTEHPAPQKPDRARTQAVPRGEVPRAVRQQLRAIQSLVDAGAYAPARVELAGLLPAWADLAPVRRLVRTLGSGPSPGSLPPPQAEEGWPIPRDQASRLRRW